MRQKIFFQILGPAVFFLMLWIGPPSEMSEPAFKVMAATIWIAIWWMTEAIPIPVTSFLPMILYPMTRCSSTEGHCPILCKPHHLYFCWGIYFGFGDAKMEST